MGKIINFHKVIDEKWFEDVVRLLKRNYTMINAGQLIDYYYNDKPLPRKSCMITVDDGDMTSYTIIYPILKKYHVPAIFFVSPEKTLRNGMHRNFWYQEARNCNGCNELMKKIHSSRITIDEIWKYIDEWKISNNVGVMEDQNMTVEQVVEIDKEGLVTIGAHTLDHPFLARENDEKSAYEIKESISQLEKLLGHEIILFAYPNGIPLKDFGDREIETLRQTSCLLAFSTEANDFKKKNNTYAIPRYGLTYGSMSFIRVKLLLGSKYKYIRRLLITKR